MPSLSRADKKRLHKWLRWQHRRSCPRKIGHDTKESARAHIDSLVREQGELRAALNIYRCLACGKLHVGHAPLYPVQARLRRK